MSIYILSGKVFGNNIYEIDYVENVQDRVKSNITGFPESNILHHSVSIDDYCIKTCKALIFDKFYDYKLKNNSHFYKISLKEAINIVDNIILNLSYSKHYEDEQLKKEIKTTKNCLFFS